MCRAPGLVLARDQSPIALQAGQSTFLGTGSRDMTARWARNTTWRDEGPALFGRGRGPSAFTQWVAFGYERPLHSFREQGKGLGRWARAHFKAACRCTEPACASTFCGCN
ncbi:hypothetical protein Zmor_024302 [Zophobas morio]|uniref:Uncharacterized protein n=1 Tax=Zophobas morio TaxID=2755281 RepID=A0AA38I0N6_9CUCU|nr:hypothetical protein Zmor_024302 [Zophobas morio]